MYKSVCINCYQLMHTVKQLSSSLMKWHIRVAFEARIITIKRGLHKHLLLFMRLVKFSSSVARLKQVLKTCEIFVTFVVSSSKTKLYKNYRLYQNCANKMTLRSEKVLKKALRYKACEQAPCGSLAGGWEKKGELATTSLELEYLRQKTRCEMLIG